MSAKITRWEGKQKLSNSHLNEVWDLEAKRAAMINDLVSDGVAADRGINSPIRIIIAKIVDAGPAAEADYTDERHWAIEVIINNDGTITEYDQIETSDADPWHAPNDTMVPVILTITNLSDLADHTHTLTIGQYVLVFALIDSTPVDSDGNVIGAPNFRYVTLGGSESKGEFIGMNHTMVAQNVDGWQFDTLHAELV